MTKEDQIQQVVRSIPHGSENAISAERLSSVTGIEERAIRELIHSAINEGYPVASGNGYFIPGTPDEWQKCLAGLRKRKGSTAERYQAMKQYAQEHDVFNDSHTMKGGNRGSEG